jgi:conjugal transfer pilin signal peptidase TrbI
MLPARYWRATIILAPLMLLAAMHFRVNVSASLPWSLAYVEYSGRIPAIGEYVVYEFRGDMKGLPSRTFFKQVVGKPGDVIRVEGRSVWVDRLHIGEAATHSRLGTPLTPIRAGVIPPGHLFARGLNPGSFDSRYQESGLVPYDAVIGVAWPIF